MLLLAWIAHRTDNLSLLVNRRMNTLTSFKMPNSCPQNMQTHIT